MATIASRAPFFVPRPAEENFWSRGPAPSPFLRFATQQKMFGIGGQAPAKRWSQLYDYNVAESFWNATPIDSTIVSYLTKQKIFGVGGQVPTKLWRYDYDVAESFWQGSPLLSKLLAPLLTAVGQVKSRQWLFGYDDPPVWTGEPVNSALIQLLTNQVLFGKGGQVLAKQWHYDIDDMPSWSPWANRNLANSTIAISKPFINIKWNYSDDASVWFPWANRNLATFLPVTGQVVFDAVSIATPIVNAAGPLTWTHTPVGTPTAVAILLDTFGGGTPTGVTYGGITCALANSATNTDNTFIYGLANPPSGPQTVQVSYTGNAYWVGFAVTVTGSDTSTAFSNTAANTGSTANISSICTSVIGELVVDIGSQDSSTGSQTADLGQTDRGQSTSSGLMAGISTKAGASSVTMGWTLPLATTWVSVSASFKAGGVVNKPFVKKWNYDYDDPSSWSPWVNRAITLFGSVIVNPFIPRYWRYNNDDLSLWSGEPIGSAIIPSLTQQKIFGLGGQVPTKQWHYDIDDPPAWSGEPINSATIQFLTQQKIFGLGGQVPVKQWRYDYDDASTWFPWVNRNLSNITAVIGKPFTNVFWNNLDDSSLWSGEPINSATIQFLTQQKMFGLGGQVPAKQWRYDYDDSSTWFPWINRNLSNITTVVGKPFTNRFWNNLDDSSLWSGKPAGSAIIPLLTVGGKPLTYRWSNRFDYDIAESFWQQTTNRNSIIFVPSLNPFSVTRWNFTIDDPAIWQPIRQSNSVLLATPFFATRTSSTIDDFPVWQWIPSHNLTASIVTNPLITVGWKFHFDDQSTWQRTINRNLLIITPQQKPFVPNFYKFDYDDQYLWQSTLRWNSILAVAPLVLPFPARRWNLVIDDAAFIWQWQPRNNRFLPYRFEPERVAYTMAENRIAVAPIRPIPVVAKEGRTALTLAEKRSGKTTLENRSPIAPEDKE